MEVMKKSKSDAARVSAAVALLARGWGAVRQELEFESNADTAWPVTIYIPDNGRGEHSLPEDVAAAMDHLAKQKHHSQFAEASASFDAKFRAILETA